MQSSGVSVDTFFDDLGNGLDSKVHTELVGRHEPRGSSYVSKVSVHKHLPQTS